ncbi:glycosyltransferase [Sphingomonas psychrotolerans]|uniref:Glycosyltransferase n=1 Tax=Sphingomonas psychrotolerans TaxID=1327635 RepID=A0ABU3N5C9_9SPHN|nr:glycosyltransferase [Sphingomonas psychrotolerans]MDT8759724.1 glycosyltransferase [Sphingomonas psychrotolerans]
MRLFQNSGVYRSYRPRLARLTADCRSFDAARKAFLDDRFGAAHFLAPVLEGRSDAFLANGDDAFSQQLWASEQGLPADTSLEDILLAQIEHHKTEVFYNLDPVRYGDAFLKRLPGSVKRSIAWRAAPSGGADFLAYDAIVNNFPSLLEGYRAQGARAEYLFPAHDPEMDAYAGQTERPTDVLFVGSYSRHHRARAEMLEAIAGLRRNLRVVMHLDVSRYTRLAETPLGWVGPLRKDRRARDIRAVAQPPVFGRDLLAAIGRAKIVVNGAIDMAGSDRGNMRIWEALGCGAALISDAGTYPPHISAGKSFMSYDSPQQVPQLILDLIRHVDARSELARSGHEMIRTAYSKKVQWERFVEIAG